MDTRPADNPFRAAGCGAEPIHPRNETFFEDVRVPAANIIDEENRGWYVATTTLDFERSGVQRTAGVRMSYDSLVEHVKDPANGVELSDVQRHALAETRTEVEIARYIGYRVTWMQSQGLAPNYESSMAKVFGSELMQRNVRGGVNLLGLAGALKLASDYAIMDGRYCRLYMSSVTRTIAAGASEVQRNIIATRGLGLPRG